MAAHAGGVTARVETEAKALGISMDPPSVPLGAGAAAQREIRLAQAASFAAFGDEWMLKPANPSPRIKYGHASRLFQQAAEIYRCYGRWRLAGECYHKVAEAEKKIAELLIAATFFVDAGECLARVDGAEGVKMFAQATALYASLSRFLTAAGLQMRIGEMYEVDGAATSAAQAFSLAAEYFLAEDLYPQAVQALWRAGAAHASEDSFELAHDTFEKAARFAADDNLSRFRGTRLQFNAALALCAAGAWDRADRYIYMSAKRDAVFSTGKEKRFLFDVVDTARAWAGHDLLDHVWNYDYVDPLHPHELRMLQAVYESVRDGPPAEVLAARKSAKEAAAAKRDEASGKFKEEEYDVLVEEEVEVKEEGGAAAGGAAAGGGGAAGSDDGYSTGSGADTPPGSAAAAAGGGGR